MQWRRKRRPMRLKITSDTAHGSGSTVELGGHDLTSCLQRVELDVSCGGATKVTLHAIAVDGHDVDVEVGELKIVERTYLVSRPEDSPLHDTPVRKLLSEIEVEA